MNSAKPVDFEKEVWKNFESREFVINNIKQTFPDSNWQDPSWGLLDNSKAVIEFNIGDKEDMDNTFMLHIRGGQDPTAEIAKMCKQHNCGKNAECDPLTPRQFKHISLWPSGVKCAGFSSS